MTVDPAVAATGDAAVDVKQLVADLEALPGVLQVRATWRDENPGVFLGVVLAEFDWEVRRRIIEMVDAVHRAHANELSVEFDIVDRDHSPFGDFV